MATKILKMIGESVNDIQLPKSFHLMEKYCQKYCRTFTLFKSIISLELFIKHKLCFNYTNSIKHYTINAKRTLQQSNILTFNHVVNLHKILEN